MKFMIEPNFFLMLLIIWYIGDEELRYILKEKGNNLKLEEIEEVVNNYEYKKWR